MLGLGRPCSLRSGSCTTARMPARRSTSRGGRRRTRMPVPCDGHPSRDRGRMCGGVRTESHTRVAPCSARSVAISIPCCRCPPRGRRAPHTGGRCVVARDAELGRESVASGPRGDDGSVVVSGGHDHVLGADARAVLEFDDEPGLALAPDHPAHRGTEPEAQTVVGGVLLEVGDDVVAGDPAAVASGDRQAGQPGPPARGVQVQPVVVVAPALTDPGRAIDDEGVDTPLPQRRSHGQATRTGTDHDHSFAAPRVGCSPRVGRYRRPCDTSRAALTDRGTTVGSGMIRGGDHDRTLARHGAGRG